MAEGNLTSEPVVGTRTGKAHTVLHLGGVNIDARKHIATVAGTALELTKTEFKLLRTLVSKPCTPLARETLFQDVWGYDMQFNTNSLEVMVYRLRSKLSTAGATLVIRTIRNFGYIAEDNPTG